MKKLNLYYIVSIATLAFMMFILFRFLQVTGWFEEHQGRTPAERVTRMFPGEYLLKSSDSTGGTAAWVYVVADEEDPSAFVIHMDSIPEYLVNLSDFEDEQVLIEIYDLDSAGTVRRLDGCELLLAEDSTGLFQGSTIGDFCGLDEQSQEYLAMDILLAHKEASLGIQEHKLGQVESLNIRKYWVERKD